MIITPPFTEMQKKILETIEKIENKCDVDGIDDLDDITITNFDRITASPEALAKWVFNTMDFCSRGCSNCPIKEKCLSSNSKGTEMNLLEWLNEEKKE